MSEVKILEQTATDEIASPPTSPWLARLIEAAILLLGLGFVILLRVSVYEPAYIPSPSMANTLLVGDRVLLDHRSTLRGHWRRGDIVLFVDEGGWGEEGDTLIKRVIGLPGENVRIEGGQVYVNNTLITENYLKEKQRVEDPVEITLGSDEYFVMGDNRNDSDDSRYNGAVKDAQIQGRAALVFYPLSRFGRVGLPQYDSLKQ